MADLIISCLSQKGGVGKSTLARLIARTYAVAGWKVKICDFNTTQLTSKKWSDVRRSMDIEPTIDSEPYTAPTRLRREPYDLVVADGRPDSDQSSLAIARISDLVILPTGTAVDDLEPQLAFAKELTSKGVSHEAILFTLNKIDAGTSAVGAAREYLEGFNVADQELMSRVSYQRTQNFGKALSEVEDYVGNLAEHADILAAEIVDRVNKRMEAA